jgi:DNA-binding CsgD family transcriptional regulator
MTGVPTRLVGRSAELALGRALVDRVFAGRGGFVLIEGEAGIGKTSVFSELLDERAHIVRGAGHELGRDRPFGLLAEALGVRRRADREIADLKALLSSPAPTDPAAQFPVIDAIVDHLEALALAGPVVLALEDLHWADTPSVLALHGVVRRLDVVPLCVVATARRVPRTPELARLSAEPGIDRIELRPLDAGSVALLVEHELGARPPAALLRRLDAAAGNPLYVTELLAALRSEGAVDDSGDARDRYDRGLPVSLRMTIVRRLGFLPAATLDLVRLASILGGRFEASDLAAVARISPSDLEPRLRPAVEAGVLHEDGDLLAFRHDLVRDAVYEDIPATMRKALHADAGRSLVEAGAPAAQVAVHMSLGASVGDTQAVAWLRKAAREALLTDEHTAADLLRRAVELLGPRDRSRPAALADLAFVLVSIGPPSEAERMARAALATAPDAWTQWRARNFLWGSLLQQGRVREAADEASAMLTIPGLPGVYWARAFGARAVARVWMGDLAGSAQDARDAIDIAHGTGDFIAIVYGFLALASAAYTRGDLEGTIAACRGAVPSDEPPAADPYAPELRRSAYLLLARALSDADRLEEAERVSRAFMAFPAQGRHLVPGGHEERGVRHYRAGRWDDAIAELQAGIAMADEMGGPLGRPAACLWLARIALHRDDRAGLRAAMTRVDEDFSAGAVGGFDRALYHWMQALLAMPDTAAALEHLERAWRHVRRGGIGGGAVVGPDLIRCRLAAGDKEGAREVAAAVTSSAERAGNHASARGMGLRCCGLASNDAGLLLDAVAAYRSSPRPVELAFACEDAGAALARADRKTDAVPLLEEAQSRYEAVGALVDARRATAALRALGVRRGPAGRRGRPAAGWDAITPTESRVVGLLCEGLTNRQVAERLFVSRRTVDAHVAHIFQKLGVSSRTELVVRAAGRQDLG